MKKRKSPKEIIESIDNPHLETSWLKFPGKELEDASLVRKEGSVIPSYENSPGFEELENRVRERYLKGHKEYRATGIHTHTNRSYESASNKENEFYRKHSKFPSEADLRCFIKNPHIKAECIAQTDEKTGELLGYTILRKTKKTPNTYRNLHDDLLRYKEEMIKGGLSGDSSYFEYGLKEFAKEYNLQYKHVEVKKHLKIESSLVKGLMIISGSSLLLSSFFASSNLTGKVITNLSDKTVSFIGASLFIIGLITGVFWLKIRKNK